ncbi:hypothetical protein ACU4GD_12325 [Cupriavidus basilensis]
MMVLWEADGLTVSGQSARGCTWIPATPTPLLKRMEAQQLVRRERAAMDEPPGHRLADSRRSCAQASRPRPCPARCCALSACSVEQSWR